MNRQQSNPFAGQTTSLYRFFDAADRLLYIGITNSIPRRLDQHHSDKPWYQSVTRVAVEHHPSRQVALSAEKAAIKSERPQYNVVHNSAAVPRPSSGRQGKWLFQSRRSGQEIRTDLQLYPELDCSAILDDYGHLDAEGQFLEYGQYIYYEHRDWWDTDAVPIVWSVHSNWRGVFEAAPFTGDEPPWGDFLAHYTWPVAAETGDPLDWYRLPVVNDRFPEFAKELAWTPSALQPSCPLRSLMYSRAGLPPLAKSDLIPAAN